MNFSGIILTGPKGKGKTTIAKKIQENDKFQIVRAVTTRKKRADDINYIYVSNEEFREMKNTNRLFVNDNYHDQNYGIKFSDIKRVIDDNKIPILIITPNSIKSLYDDNPKIRQKIQTYFIDAEDNELDVRKKSDDEMEISEIKLQRESDRLLSPFCDYTLLNYEVDKCVGLILELWEYKGKGGVLPKRIIKNMIDCGILIDKNTYNQNNIKGASYDLSLGDEYSYGGEIKKLSETNHVIKIKPYDCAIVRSKELFKFPGDISGKFDLKVSLFCNGVILSNGPQVDPGWNGALFCLLYNTSNKTINIRRGDHYATIEFHKLIEPTDHYKGKYQSHKEVWQYLSEGQIKGAGSEIREELEKTRKEGEKLRLANKINDWAIYISIILGLIIFAEAMFLFMLQLFFS